MKMHISSLAIVGAFFTALAASQELTKPPVQDNLDNLKRGLVNNLKVTQSSREKFRAGWMPKVCKDIANNEKRKPADFQIWKVKYNDVRSAAHSTPFSINPHPNIED